MKTRISLLFLALLLAPTATCSQLEIPAGLSIVSVPNPPSGYLASNLASLLNARLIVRTVPSGFGHNRFDVFIPGTEGPEFVIERGRGYLVNLGTPRLVDIDTQQPLPFALVEGTVEDDLVVNASIRFYADGFLSHEIVPISPVTTNLLGSFCPKTPPFDASIWSVGHRSLGFREVLVAFWRDCSDFWNSRVI